MGMRMASVMRLTRPVIPPAWATTPQSELPAGLDRASRSTPAASTVSAQAGRVRAYVPPHRTRDPPRPQSPLGQPHRHHRDTSAVTGRTDHLSLLGHVLLPESRRRKDVDRSAAQVDDACAMRGSEDVVDALPASADARCEITLGERQRDRSQAGPVPVPQRAQRPPDPIGEALEREQLRVLVEVADGARTDGERPPWR
jgi:hypothetical protein